uniref:Uncharacterized protein LOC104227412 n=1 Tax=Nicotiana sylvestris TaxID=4096 RepID=A0A1U7WDA1_NICSY|nr:PREDICTED: uncharacterized protein LOC104227412 [Nicotiana sylvestris]
MKNLSINVLLVEALGQMSGYAKFMKDLVTKKCSMNCEIIKFTHQVSAIVPSMDLKFEDPGAFMIPYTIGSAEFAKAPCDLGIVRLIKKCRLFLGDLSLLRRTLFVILKMENLPSGNEVYSFVDLVTDVIIDDTSATVNVGDILEVVLLNIDDDEMDGFMKYVNSLQGMG